MNSEPSPVVVLGNLTLDTLYWVDAIPPLDEVAVVIDSTTCVGGRGAIVAATVSALGIPAGLCTYTGDVPLDLLRPLINAGMRTDGTLICVPDRAPSQVFVTIGQQNRNCTSLLVPSSLSMLPIPSQEEAVAQANVLYFTTHDIDFNRHFLVQPFTNGKSVVHNLSQTMWENLYYFDLVRATASIIILNAFECSKMLSHHRLRGAGELFSACQRLHGLIITRGESGVELFVNGRESILIPVVDTPVRTPVGAGDAFAAGIVYGELQGWDLRSSCQLGVAVAADSVASSTSYPQLEGLARRLLSSPLPGQSGLYL